MLDKLDLPPALPLFDSGEYAEEPNSVINEYVTQIALRHVPDAGLIYEYTHDWLMENKYSPNNYKTYRSEITTFLHWCFEVAEMSVVDVKRSHLSQYIDWCSSPPKHLIAAFNSPQFIVDKWLGIRAPNPKWRPFTGQKLANGEIKYSISASAMKTRLAALSTYFSYLINEEIMERNPAMMLLKTGRFKQSQQSRASGEDDDEIKSFSELQWSYVMDAAHELAEENPDEHERTLFMVSLMYGCFLRISEIAARVGYSPVMSQFRRDPKTGVWGFYIPESKGGKRRTVAVSNALLDALKRYRQHLGLTPLPAPDDYAPLFIRHHKASHGRDAGLINANLGIRRIRDVIDALFARAADLAENDSHVLDAQEMRTMTPHSLRHTGITHDINLNNRPLSHVQADAGHDSIDTTSRYLHTSRTERHESAAGKLLTR